MMIRKKFVFLAHRVENWTWLLNFTNIFAHLHRNPKLRWMWMWLWPICAVASVIYLFARKGYDTVDSFEVEAPDGTLIQGETVLLKNMAWHFLSSRGRKQVRRRVERAVLELRERGFTHIGLGALTKAEFINHGGVDVVEKFGDQINGSYVLHADTGTDGGTAKQVRCALAKYGIKSPVFVTGATSKIGRAVALDLARSGVYVKLYTSSKERFVEIWQEAKEKGFGKFLSQAVSLEEGKECRLWLTGKAVPSGKKMISFIPADSVVMNFSVPNPFGEGRLHPRRRKDVLLVECGLAAYEPPSFLPLAHTMRQPRGLTYMCHASTITAAWKGYEGHEVSKVDIDRMSEVWQDVESLGFFLPPLPEMEMEEVFVPAKKGTDRWLWQKTRELAKSFAMFF